MGRRHVFGDPQLWLDTFPESLIPEIIQLILRVWSELPRTDRGEMEVSITKRFRSALIQDKNLRKEIPVRIERESVEDDINSGEELGRIDLRFTSAYQAREDVYFAFECKRLNVISNGKFQSLAGKYVKEGMMRFVVGQYAQALNCGGMLAYVMDGNLPSARKAVDAAVRRRCSKLCIAAPTGLRRSVLSKSGCQIDETVHALGSRSFTLYHLLVKF